MGKKGKIEIPSTKKSLHDGSSRLRQQTRRAASKEALKQMQRFLENESEPVEIPDDDDDDVVTVSSFSSSSKKKYKLSHRKSSDGNDREVLVLKSIKPNPYLDNDSLELDCWIEDLEPCQIERNKKLQDDAYVLKTKLDELVKNYNGEVIHSSEFSNILEFSEFIGSTDHSNQPANIVLNNNTPNSQSGYQLVVDPRLGLVLGTVQPAGSPSLAVQPTPSEPKTTKTSKSKKTNASTVQTTPRTAIASKQPHKKPQATTHATRSKNLIDVTSRGKISTISSNVKATETTVEGGLGTGKKTRFVVDLTGDDGKPTADSKEVTFNKLQGKTYPSLAVVARPYLKATDVNLDRSKLDSKVKTVLMCAPAKFAEWLIQQGLIKSEQKCSVHGNPCKLGMYSDVTKFPHSGGYVWISDCCSQKFVSIFSGSIFESSPHPPLVILKVLYHWACQTNIQNIIQWVKVDSLFVKGMYSWLRSICTVASQTHFKPFGGPQVKVEVGVISLGTTSQDGNSRQVKVEVLGVLEAATKRIRLRAIEPLSENDRGFKKRFLKILEPLAKWVHTSSIIVTDVTVDKITLRQLGFYNVIQSSFTDTNKTIMDYLRRIVPRMFQNTLSLLSRPIIQQFLDELVWRERYGTTALEAFDNLLLHLAEQTRHESAENIIIRLNRIATNPFKNWALTVKPATIVTIGSGTSKPVPESSMKKRKRKAEKDEVEINKSNQPSTSSTDIAASRPSKSASPDVPEQMVPLESYYYGVINNHNQPLQTKACITLNMKCPLCKESFHNNILLMTHLFKHAHNISKGEMCKYCLASVPSSSELTKHIVTSHPTETRHDRGFVCLICETYYMNPFVLGKHMSKEHCPSELPYQCGTCGYRCSNHKQAIDHFYNKHDGGPTIQCPFCLKSTTAYSSSRNIAQNLSFFLQHIQKHQKKQYARRCGKCNLWFIQKELKTDHQNKMHTSQRGKTGLSQSIAPRNGIMVPKSKMDVNPCDAEGINFNTLFFNISKKLNCIECNKPMDTPKHFPSYEICSNRNCQYATCCSVAMQEHKTKCNKSSHMSVVMPEEKLPCEMFCICGYSSTDGNQMAKHLTICEKKSAYPSIGDAKNASVTRSMLDVLGLVRKADEKLSGSPSGPSPFSLHRKKVSSAANKTDDTDTCLIESEDDVIAIEEPPEKKLKQNLEEDIDDFALVQNVGISKEVQDILENKSLTADTVERSDIVDELNTDIISHDPVEVDISNTTCMDLPIDDLPTTSDENDKVTNENVDSIVDEAIDDDDEELPDIDQREEPVTAIATETTTNQAFFSNDESNIEALLKTDQESPSQKLDLILDTNEIEKKDDENLEEPSASEITPIQSNTEAPEAVQTAEVVQITEENQIISEAMENKEIDSNECVTDPFVVEQNLGIDADLSFVSDNNTNSSEIAPLTENTESNNDVSLPMDTTDLDSLSKNTSTLDNATPMDNTNDFPMQSSDQTINPTVSPPPLPMEVD